MAGCASDAVSVRASGPGTQPPVLDLGREGAGRVLGQVPGWRRGQVAGVPRTFGRGSWDVLGAA